MNKLKFGGVRRPINATKNMNTVKSFLKENFLDTFYTLYKTIFCSNKWSKFRVGASYGLSDRAVFTQAIAIVSEVSMSDVLIKLVMATAELGLDVLNGWFEVSDYECV